MEVKVIEIDIAKSASGKCSPGQEKADDGWCWEAVIGQSECIVSDGEHQGHELRATETPKT